ncbi:MAG: hypothetical protein QM755_23650 [Luteolibacter sp.]
MSIDVASGYIMLELWEDALEALEDLSPDERSTPDVMVLRLRCCRGMAKWDLGSVLAELLRHGNEEHRHAAAEFWHALAAAEMADGNLDFAREAARKAATASPDVRLAMLDDPALASLW